MKLCLPRRGEDRMNLAYPKWLMEKYISLPGLATPSLGNFTLAINFTYVRDTFRGKATLSLIFKQIKAH